MPKVRNKKNDGLNDRQRRFCEEYLKDLNATKAAERAGYSKKTAPFIGSENLNKPQIKAQIQKLQDARSKRTEITADRVLKELAKIGFSDLKDYMSWNDEKITIIDSQNVDAKAVSEVMYTETTIPQKNGDDIIKIQKKIKLYDKVAALTKIGEHLGMFSKKGDSYNDDERDLILRAATKVAQEHI